MVIRVAMNMNLIINSRMLRSKEIFQILKKSLGTSEGSSSVGGKSFEKEKKKKVQVSHAWTFEPKLTKKSKINLSLVERFFWKK